MTIDLGVIEVAVVAIIGVVVIFLVFLWILKVAEEPRKETTAKKATKKGSAK